MAELTIEPAETVRVRVERALAARGEPGERSRPRADGGTDRGDAPLLRRGGAERAAPRLSARTSAALAAELRNELVGLSGIAERVLDHRAGG